MSSQAEPAYVIPKYLPLWVTAVGLFLVLLAGLKVLVLDTNMIVLFAICVFVWVLPTISKFEYARLKVETRLAKLEAEQEKTVEALTEPEDAALTGTRETNRGSALDSTADQPILAALADARYAFRSLPAIMRRSGLGADAAEKELLALAGAGLVVQVTGRGGKRLWGLTSRGRAAVSSS